MKNNRLGALLIISSLIVITVLIGLSLLRQQEARLEQIRGQGLGVVRSLTVLPFDMLVPQGQGAGVLQSLFQFYKPSDFAYGAITTRDGKLLGEVVNPGVITPSDALPPNADTLVGERTLVSPQNNRKIREFYGPVSTAESEPAFVRVGYFEPRIHVAEQELSYLAMLALPTFLLVPLIYLIFNREMRPLRSAYEKLEAVITEKGNALTVAPVHFDLQAFAGKVNTYIQNTNARMAELEQEKIGLVTKNRLLEYGNNKLNFVLQSLPDGLMVLDPAGHITFASAKVEAMLGIDLNTILSRRVDEWCDEAAFKSLLLRYQTSNVQSLRPETIEFHPDGEQNKRIRVLAQPLIVANEGPSFGTLIVLQDITREFLGQCASQDFVAHVSHELKSPLNVISMYCEMLQDDADGNDSMRIEATNVIHDEVERMSALVNNLLNISKIEVGGFKPNCTRVKIEDLLQDIYNNNLSKAMANQIAMEIAVDREIAAVSIDKDMFRIAVNNLVSNAIKYSNEGGRVVLQAREENGFLVIAVQDSGIGIPVEDQANVFKKFVRAKGGEGHKRSGHGLGLYLANEIVQLHHGQIALESEPGKGSKFSIYLKASSSKELNLL